MHPIGTTALTAHEALYQLVSAPLHFYPHLLPYPHSMSNLVETLHLCCRPREIYFLVRAKVTSKEVPPNFGSPTGNPLFTPCLSPNSTLPCSSLPLPAPHGAMCRITPTGHNLTGSCSNLVTSTIPLHCPAQWNDAQWVDALMLRNTPALTRGSPPHSTCCLPFPFPFSS